jgi:hypothetical protein
MPENTGVRKFFQVEKRDIFFRTAHPKGEPQEIELFAYAVGKTVVA